MWKIEFYWLGRWQYITSEIKEGWLMPQQVHAKTNNFPLRTRRILWVTVYWIEPFVCKYFALIPLYIPSFILSSNFCKSVKGDNVLRCQQNDLQIAANVKRAGGWPLGQGPNQNCHRCKDKAKGWPVSRLRRQSLGRSSWGEPRAPVPRAKGVAFSLHQA